VRPIPAHRLLLILAAGFAAGPGMAAEVRPGAADGAATVDGRALRRSPVVEVFEKTHGAVVNISSTRVVRVRRSFSDPFFYNLEDIFGGRPQQQQLSSVGSGFLIHKGGYIVTNAHVVDRATDIKVIFDDQRSFDAHMVASDAQHDLALLKIEAPDELPVIHLGTSDDLMTGETVIAIGNPLGYQHTLTTGVISAVSRDLRLQNDKTGQEVIYEDLIQTDAGINPGSSGGPLLNVLGELIGVNTAIRADAQNIGFAIPARKLLELLPAMMAAEQAGRCYFGATVGGQGQVMALQSGSPAARAGLAVGDQVRSLDGAEIASELDFYMGLIPRRPGDRVNLELQRDGKMLKVPLTLQEPPRADGVRLAQQKLGVTLRPLPQEVADRFGLVLRGGLVVEDLEPKGPAGRVGVERGDVLTVLDRFYVTNLDEIGQVLADTQTGERVRIRILRIEGNAVYTDETRVVLR
jgi:serine protease Do